MAEYYEDFAFKVPFPEKATEELARFIDFLESQTVDALGALPEWFLKDFVSESNQEPEHILEQVLEYFRDMDTDSLGVDVSNLGGELYVSNKDSSFTNIDGFNGLLSIIMKKNNINYF